ncbi:hypothetical protein V6N13_049802 [Hibiscus sabdariffa]|uniref:Uncharacterized protein n=1 Tax=Hibiscus sabdariffa TaxID=183260 RepID=A0ABR2QW33_9ROSI
MTSTSIDTKSSTPSAVQALLGSIAAGIIALILYKFTTNIEAALNRQSVSDSFSVRQITITITVRTIKTSVVFSHKNSAKREPQSNYQIQPQ